MQFSLLFVTLASALSAFAQFNIALPTPGQTLHPGQSFTVRVEKLDVLSLTTEVGIAIGLSNGQPVMGFEDASHNMYTILFAGPFSPQPESPGGTTLFQDYSVTVPSSFTPGESVLNVGRAALFGRGPYLGTDILNVTVTLA
ncbi:hypothetical protein BD410DRAFT_795550 [Rickenella mellea]|uniref:DUF4402 domain-containing protein n=1 Tax=Rickenella mellea TaxID=50990 RepID=A0A4Y7PME1_9AGAM|nr:hypothetical protein BD410DRAFT_795550 [Rickenella mellea]